MTSIIRLGWRAAAAALVIAVLMAGAVAIAAADELQVTLGNPGLTHFDSDGGVELDFGLTDQAGQPVGNLTKDNIEVREDGAVARILYFRGKGQGRPVDIVFVLDVTESMQPYIDAVKQTIITFAHDLAANNRDYRLGLVTFEDYVVSQYPDCNCEYRNTMTSDVQKFIGWVGTLHATGGGDIPEDQLDGLAYAASLPFRPEAQGIVILVSDAPPHVAGDGPDREGDEGYRLHHPDPNADVTEETGPKVAALYQKNGLTFYAVAPPPFSAPEYAGIVEATHGRLYNIVTEQNRFPDLVREIGHSIATEYSLTYLTPRPIEDGTNRAVQLRVTYNGQTGAADTSYQVKGIGGAAINEPAAGAGPGEVTPQFAQFAFAWWNGALPLAAILGLIALSRMRFGVSSDELKAIVEAQSKAPAPNLAAAAREVAGRARAAATPAPSAPPSTAPPPRVMTPMTISGAGAPHEARLTTLDKIDSIPTEYALLKPEVAVGRGEDNDIVIPHASVSRNHARLARRDGGFELIDLNSTNGSYVDQQLVQGSASIANGSEVRFGDIRFTLRF
jgi:FHA domain-containing protein/integrin beta-like protein